MALKNLAPSRPFTIKANEVAKEMVILEKNNLVTIKVNELAKKLVIIEKNNLVTVKTNEVAKGKVEDY